jgi:hypothetical protein
LYRSIQVARQSPAHSGGSGRPSIVIAGLARCPELQQAAFMEAIFEFGEPVCFGVPGQSGRARQPYSGSTIVTQADG